MGRMLGQPCHALGMGSRLPLTHVLERGTHRPAAAGLVFFLFPGGEDSPFVFIFLSFFFLFIYHENTKLVSF